VVECHAVQEIVQSTDRIVHCLLVAVSVTDFEQVMVCPAFVMSNIYCFQ